MVSQIISSTKDERVDWPIYIELLVVEISIIIYSVIVVCSLPAIESTWEYAVITLHGPKQTNETRHNDKHWQPSEVVSIFQYNYKADYFVDDMKQVH